MSKFKNFKLEKKDEIEMDKMETRTNIDKNDTIGNISKSKISKKEEKLNRSLEEAPLPQKEQDIKSSISIHEDSMKSEKSKKLQKYNSDRISGYFTFNNKMTKLLTVNSEQERIDKKTMTKTINFNNNNIIKRVREFVPCKEYCDLLNEIDEEGISVKTKNSFNNNDNENNIKRNIDINNNSEEHNLKNIDEKQLEEIEEEQREIEEKKELNKNMETQNDEESKNKKINEEIKTKNKNKFDIYIDTEINTMQKLNELNNQNFSLFNMRNAEQIQLENFLRMMKENREKKFKREFYNCNIYTTNIYFKYGEYSSNIKQYQESILLLRKPFLYILNPNKSVITEESVKFFNPDISLINSIGINNNNETAKNNYLLKNKFNLSSPLLSLNFNLLSCKLLVNKISNEFQIIILGTKQKFSFILTDKDLFSKYIFLIQDIISNTEGSKYNLLGLSIRNNTFYKESYITPYEFESQAKTGDLLLFRTIDICADCQRFFTCDNYDHVGLIIKENKKIYIFESTSLGKCDTLSWNCFKTLFFNLIYHRIAYRKLNYENEDSKKVKENQKYLEEKCKQFKEKIRGKEYYLSIPRFLCCKKPEEYEYDMKWDKAQGFCCSALAAALYINIGIVKLEKSVHSTRPGDFEHDRNRLTFEKGYSLGPEKIIEFSN
jgi:hypothetical protein